MADPGADAAAHAPRDDLPPTLDPALIDLALSSAGPVDAPAILLLHGTRRTRAMWHRQVADLAGDFHVLTLDLPGHGTLADIPFRLADASAAVATAIRQLPAGRAVIVGQSLGGYVGMDVAAHRPALVAGLVLASATAEPRSLVRHAPRAVGAYLVAAAGESIRARNGETVGSTGVGGTSARTGPTQPPATAGWLFKGGTRAMVSALRESFLPRLAAYRGPILIVNGFDDSLFRSEEREFLSRATNGRLEVIPGTGHLVAEEQPEAFNAAVRHFALEAFGQVAPADARPGDARVPAACDERQGATQSPPGGVGGESR
jgi:pimeloyl-ACP methyl ester carboxylesterase